jgi:CheY-like chemotaxis protein
MVAAARMVEMDEIYFNNKVNILVADDDVSYLNSVSELLKFETLKIDGQVDSVSSLQEAQDLIEKVKYDLVLVDYRFHNSKMNGSDFILKNLSLLEQSKKIIVTGFSNLIENKERLSRLDVEIIIKGTHFVDKVLKSIQSIKQDKIKNTKESVEDEFIALGLFENKINLVSLAKDGDYQILDETKQLHNILYTVSSETAAFRIAIDELEALINDKNSKEKDFQDFFNRHKDFILNDDYKEAHQHIYLEQNDADTLIPDFMLEPVDTFALCDLLELKLPSTPVYILKKRRMRYSSAVMEACAQLREYSVYFENESNRNKIFKKYGLLSFRPKMFVIIGRKGTINPIDRRKIEGDIPNLRLNTYDEITLRAKTKLDNWIKGKKSN